LSAISTLIDFNGDECAAYMYLHPNFIGTNEYLKGMSAQFFSDAMIKNHPYCDDVNVIPGFPDTPETTSLWLHCNNGHKIYRYLKPHKPQIGSLVKREHFEGVQSGNNIKKCPICHTGNYLLTRNVY